MRRKKSMSSITAAVWAHFRRSFLKQNSPLTAGVAAWSFARSGRAAPGPNDKVRLAIVGCHNRGMNHITGDSEASALWPRTCRDGWEPKI
jgi:hypothetical protein